MPPGGSISFNNLLTYLKKENSEHGSHLISHLSVKNRTDRCGFPVIESHKNSINILISLFINKDAAIRKEALSLLQLCITSEDLTTGPPKQIFDDESCEKLEKEIFPGLTKMLQDSKDTGVMDYWDILVKILGFHLHTRTKLLNTAMLVVQSAFKMPNPRIVERALRSWVVLMENFALVPEIINAPKRVKLLVMALKYRSPVQDETTYRLRIECWMELMYLLGKNITFHGQDLVKEFLVFCFGQKPGLDESKDSMASPSRPGFTPTKAMTPAKKFASLERVCLDALVQLFGSRPFSSALPKSCFKHQLIPDQPILPNEFKEMSHLVFDALENMTVNVRYTNRSEVLKLTAVWEGVGREMTSIAALSSPNETLCQYLRAISSTEKHLRRQEKLHSLLFNLLENILKLPESILNSRMFSHTALEHKVSPLVFVYGILLQEVILNSKEETKGLHNLFELCSVHVHHKEHLIDILEKMEMVAPHLTFIGYENLSMAWQALCHQAGTWQDLLEVKGLSKSFTKIQQFLRFPLQYLPDREPRFWREWGNLFVNMYASNELTVGMDSAKVLDEMIEKLSGIYKGLEGSKKSTAMLPQVRCLQMMFNEVTFTSICREIRVKKSQEPLSVFKTQLAPIGNATKAIQFLNELCGDALATPSRDTELMEIILDTYTTVIKGVESTDLLKPALKIMVPKICSLLREDSLTSLTTIGLAPVAMKLFDCLTTVIEARYSNTKDSTDTQILEILENFFIQCFQSKRSQIKSKISEVWAVTFSNVASEKIPERLKNVLKQFASPGLRTQVSSDSQSGETNSFPSTSEFLDKVVITEPGIEAALKISNKPGTPVKNTRAASRNSPFKTNFELKDSIGSPEKISPRKSIRSPAMKPPKAPAVRLEDEDSCQFVKIAAKPKGKRVLTDHQKEKMTSRRDDIPALYSELSRDDSIINIPSQFMSQHSMDESSSSNASFPPPNMHESAVPEKARESSKQTADSGKDCENESAKDKSTEDKVDGKPPLEESIDEAILEKVEDPIESPSQSLLKKDEQDNENEASNKKRGRPRKSISTPQQSSKRKRQIEEEVQTSASKRTRRQIAKEIFGDSSQSQEKESQEKVANEKEPTADKVADSVEIISSPSPAAAAADIPETITISSKDILTAEMVECGTKVTESVTILETVEVAKEDAKSEDSQDEEIIENSQKPVEEDANEKRRSRRSILKKQKCPSKNETPDKPGSASKPDSQGVDGKRNKFGETTLFAAAKKGDLEKVKQLLEQGANPNVPDAAGWIPLHEVSLSKKKDSTQIMQLLIDAGGDIQYDNDGITPLMEAVGSGNVEHVDLLLKAGAKPVGETAIEDLVRLAKEDKSVLDVLAQYFDICKVQADKEPTVIQETEEMDVSETTSDEKTAADESIEKSDDDSTKDQEVKENDPTEEAASTSNNEVDTVINDEKSSNNDHDDEKSTNVAQEKSANEDVDKSTNEKEAIIKNDNTNNEINTDDLNSSLASSTADSDISGITELENKPVIAAAPPSTDNKILTEVDKIADAEPKVKFTEVEVRSKAVVGGEKDKAENESSVIDDINNERKVSPESNKENKSDNRQGGMEMVRPALKENMNQKKKVIMQSRVSRIINLSSKTTGSETSSPDSTSPSILSPSSKRPWSRYKPSPSHASPSASILKRKRGDDTPSSTEGSPVTGKIRHVHFKPDPVSDRVEIPRSIERTATRKKLRLYAPEQDLLINKESINDGGGRSTNYEETPPLDVSSTPIYPPLTSCAIPVKDLVLQLAASVTSIKILEKDFDVFSLTTVGDLASLSAAQVRNIRGLKAPKELTVKRTLQSLAKTSLVKKSPVLEITTKEEEEKIKAALFHGPSPSPTSPTKNGFPPSPIKDSPESASPKMLLEFPSRESSAAYGTKKSSNDPWDELFAAEEPLSVRAAKAAAARSSTSSLSSNEEVTITVTTTPTTPKDTIEKADNDTEDKIMETEKTMENKKIEEEKSEEKFIEKDDKKTDTEEKKDLNDLDAIMSKGDGLAGYSKEELMVILQNTVQKQQQLSQFLTSVTLALNR